MLPLVLCFLLDYAFLDLVDLDSDEITLVCSFTINITFL